MYRDARDAQQDALHISSNYDESKIGLPFSEKQQQAILGHCMMSESFFRVLQSQVNPNWFGWPYLSKLFGLNLDFYRTVGQLPKGPAELEDWVTKTVTDQADRVKLLRAIPVCRAEALLWNLKNLELQLTEWKKMQVFYRDLPQVANLINTRKVAEAETLFWKSAQEIRVARFDGTPPVDFQKWRDIRDVAEADVKNALTTGLRALDRHLLPQAGGVGGLLPGDTTLLVAPTNAGKTSAMITIARHNLKKERDVLFITREGRDNDIATKMLQCLFRKTQGDLWAWSRTSEGERAMDVLTQRISSHVTYIHMPKVGLDVEEVVGNILSLQAARRSATGKGYDLLVVDYPGIFAAREARGARWEWRQIQDYIYRQFVQLGLEEKFHVLVAAQTNREGSKVNRGVFGTKRLLTVEDISEAFGIAMSATNVLTLNRDPKAQENNRLTFYIVKSRSSETGWAVTARSDYSRAFTHGDELGGTAYRGTDTMEQIIDSLLQEYPDRDIPEHEIQRRKALL